MADSRTDCKYGSKCYQKNAQHLAKFRHPEPTEQPAKVLKRKSDEPTVS